MEDQPKGGEKAKRKSTPRKKAEPKAIQIKVGDKCPKCGQGTIIQGHTALGCSRFREGCDFRAPLKTLS